MADTCARSGLPCNSQAGAQPGFPVKFRHRGEGRTRPTESAHDFASGVFRPKQDVETLDTLDKSEPAGQSGPGEPAPDI